jgi:hypothetical protein
MDIPDTSLHRKPPEPPFEGSEAHALLNRSIAALAMECSAIAEHTDIFRIHHDVIAFGQFDETQCIEASSELYALMQRRLFEETHSRELGSPDVLGPVRGLVKNYLVFSVPGDIARTAFARYLVSLLGLIDSVESGAKRCEFADRAQAVYLNLRQLAGTLLATRARYGLTSFYEMTFLAMLISDVTMILGRMLLDDPGVPAQMRALVAPHQRALDEEQAHELLPTLLYPALFRDFAVKGALRLTRRRAHPTPFVYPQLSADVDFRDPDRVFDLLTEKTCGLPPFDIEDFLETGLAIFDEATHHQVVKAVLGTQAQLPLP